MSNTATAQATEARTVFVLEDRNNSWFEHERELFEYMIVEQTGKPLDEVKEVRTGPIYGVDTLSDRWLCWLARAYLARYGENTIVTSDCDEDTKQAIQNEAEANSASYHAWEQKKIAERRAQRPGNIGELLAQMLADKVSNGDPEQQPEGDPSEDTETDDDDDQSTRSL